jgi:hypothetical protein
MSWKPEVIADNSGQFSGNGLAFATREEAEANVKDLAQRWTLVRDTRVVESSQPVNYAWINGKLEPVPPPSAESVMVAAHQAGVAYWRMNRSHDATREALASHARTCGWLNDANDSWLAGYLGAKRRDTEN